jgi:surface carbohydrate biosynthesis protein
MKINYFINPNKKVLSIVPYFLKEIYIKKKYFLLPENIFLRKIFIFFYLKILRKFFLLVELLLKVKIKFKSPKKFKYIIFDDNSLGVIDKILPNNDFFVLTTRIFNFKEIYITKNIITYILKNFFKRNLKINYICSLIESIEPKKIITLIDNSTEFHLIYKIFKKRNIDFYAIQNAVRDKSYYKKIFSISNYSGNYFCFGEYEVNSIKKNLIHKPNLRLKAIGSLKIELAREYLIEQNKTDLKEIYDICLISEAGSEIGTSGSLSINEWQEDQKIAAKILRHTLSFCYKHNKKLLFLGKHNLNRNNDELVKQEEYLFYEYNNKVNNFNLQFFDKSNYDNIKNLIKSRVIVGQTSTLLRESFGLKKKILVCDWGNKKVNKDFNTDAFPENSIMKLKIDSYDDFEKRLNKILDMDYVQYLSKAVNPKLIYNLDFKTLEFLRNEMKR